MVQGLSVFENKDALNSQTRENLLFHSGSLKSCSVCDKWKGKILTYMGIIGQKAIGSTKKINKGEHYLHVRLVCPKVCVPPPSASERFETKSKPPFAYMQLSPPAKESRKAEWWSQNSSWPCLQHLTSLQVCGVLRFAPWEAPVSPTSPQYTQDITHCCSITLKGAFKSSPDWSRERFLSIRLASAEPIVGKTETKHFQGEGLEAKGKCLWCGKCQLSDICFYECVIGGLDDWKRTLVRNMMSQL